MPRRDYRGMREGEYYAGRRRRREGRGNHNALASLWPTRGCFLYPSSSPCCPFSREKNLYTHVHVCASFSRVCVYVIYTCADVLRVYNHNVQLRESLCMCIRRYSARIHARERYSHRRNQLFDLGVKTTLRDEL